jgi:spore coat polysaccharide biosynthesis protein SpsF
VGCCRGSLDDVLDRFYRASVAHRAEAVVRVTADCPLIDPGLIDLCIRRFLESGADHASNAYERRYPRGLDVEVVRFSALEAACREATLPHERSHVTPFIYARPERFRLHSIRAEEDHGQHRWTVDTPADLRLARAVYQRLGPDDRFTWRDVLALLHREPGLAGLNRSIRQKALADG